MSRVKDSLQTAFRAKSKNILHWQLDVNGYQSSGYEMFRFKKRVGIAFMAAFLSIPTILASLSSGCGWTEKEQQLILPLVQQSVEFTRPSPGASMEGKLRIKRRILDWINQANRSILIFAYGLDDPDIIQSLRNARLRGVQIRLILSPEKDYQELEGQDLPLEVRNASGIQHVKAILIDSRRLISGTGNLTRSGLFHNNNAFLFFSFPSVRGERIKDRLVHPEMARPFLRFPEMTMIFSPEGGHLIQTLIAKNLYEARSLIRILMYRFTDPVLSALLYHRARSGVPVQGILDGSGTILPGRSALEEEYYNIGSIPLELFLDGNQNQYQSSDGVYHGGHMHQKTAIIDDKVFTGSYNWSMSARDRNREILFILEDHDLVQRFHHRFEKLRSRAVALRRSPHAQTTLEPEVTNSSLCIQKSSSAISVHGSGPFFHATEWKPGSEAANCDAPLRQAVPHASSAGASKGKDYSFWELDFSLIQGNGQSARYSSKSSLRWTTDFPCSRSGCKSPPLQRIDLEDGWLQWKNNSFSNHAAEITVQALGRNDWHMRTLDRQGEGFYRFAPLPKQDLLLLMEANGDTGLACIQWGALDPEIERYRQYLNFYGNPIRCITAEGSG